MINSFWLILAIFVRKVLSWNKLTCAKGIPDDRNLYKIREKNFLAESMLYVVKSHNKYNAYK